MTKEWLQLISPYFKLKVKPLMEEIIKSDDEKVILKAAKDIFTLLKVQPVDNQVFSYNGLELTNEKEVCDQYVNTIIDLKNDDLDFTKFYKEMNVIVRVIIELIEVGHTQPILYSAAEKYANGWQTFNITESKNKIENLYKQLDTLMDSIDSLINNDKLYATDLQK